MDGHFMAHRAYHSPFPNLSCRCSDCGGKGSVYGDYDACSISKCFTCDGTGQEPTKATFGFTKFIIKALESHKPAFAVLAMDSPRETLERRKLYPKYKANRGISTATDFIPQLHRMEEIARALGICVLRCEGYEADDIIATMVDVANALDDVTCTIVSRDKDLMQLINLNVRMYDPMAEEYFDGRHVIRKFGVHPQQMIEYQALVGDSGDNVPGVKGIGPKAATALLKKYPTFDKLLVAAVAATDNELKGPLKLIREQPEQHVTSRSLVTLSRNVPLDDDLSADDIKFKGLNMKRARPLFRMLGFKALGA